MKCYTIKMAGELRRYIVSSDVKEILPPVLRKRKHIATAFLNFQFFEGFNYRQFTDGETGMYGYGLSHLAASQTAHGKRVAKTSILVLYDHTRFYPDRNAGDKSRAVWINHRYELVVTTETTFRLRETGTKNVWRIVKGKLQQIVL